MIKKFLNLFSEKINIEEKIKTSSSKKNISQFTPLKISLSNQKINKSQIITSNNIIRSDINFLKYPFFNITSISTEIDRIEIKEIEKIKNGYKETYWRVSRNIDHKFPSSFARRIHKEIIEKKINNMQKPIPCLLKLGSLYQICKVLKIATAKGNRENIKKALKDIKHTSIETKQTFRVKNNTGCTKFTEGDFNLYDAVYFIGEELPDGTKSDAIYVLLSNYYVQNYNNNFTAPLDYNYIQNLKSAVTSRMYEVFSIWFYPSLEKKQDYIQKMYSTICDYFPLKRQKEKWRAKNQLKKAHEQHVTNKFLASEPEWSSVEGRKDDWLIKYIIGKRAKEWYESIKSKDKQYKKIDQNKILKEMEQTKITSINRDSNQDSMFKKLTLLNIPPEKANSILQNHKREEIEEWINALEVFNPQNKAGFLIAALKEKWKPPEHIRKKRQNKTDNNEEKLKAQYYESIFKQVDKWMEKNMDQKKWEVKVERHKEVFLQKYPFYEQFRDKPILLDSYVEADYKRTKAEELGLMTFEEWKEQRI